MTGQTLGVMLAGMFTSRARRGWPCWPTCCLEGGGGAGVCRRGGSFQRYRRSYRRLLAGLCPGGDDHCPAAGVPGCSGLSGGADSRVALHLRSGHRLSSARLPAGIRTALALVGIAFTCRRSFQAAITIAVAAKP